MNSTTWNIPASRCDSIGAHGVGVACRGTPECGRDRTRCPHPGAIEIRVTATRGERRRRVEARTGGLL